jgi:hypothetical protein
MVIRFIVVGIRVCRLVAVSTALVDEARKQARDEAEKREKLEQAATEKMDEMERKSKVWIFCRLVWNWTAYVE